MGLPPLTTVSCHLRFAFIGACSPGGNEMTLASVGTSKTSGEGARQGSAMSTAELVIGMDVGSTTVKAVPPYQQVRREFLGGRIPPSTSLAQRGMLLPGADMTIQARSFCEVAGSYAPRK